ncbi:uncharacterized protein G2W53_017330 [Senna tora]|uniref:Uncharacterized protein n=1 Tax=Senna tora TaxID=362788 RepID=A0A834TSM9_9FABA|nr:uncharacterized protein G2W53_017330 [Senna tora]
MDLKPPHNQNQHILALLQSKVLHTSQGPEEESQFDLKVSS